MKVEEIGWMEASGSAIHLQASGAQTSGVLKMDGVSGRGI